MLNKSQTLALLKTLGHQPDQRYGQNFLIDKNMVLKAVSLGDVRAGETVVEIGPGLGTLTHALYAASAKVVAVEKDKKLYTHLRSNFPDITLVETDALKVDYKQFGNFKVIANLPYSISSPILDSFLDALPSRMVLMVQKELAERYMATRGRDFAGLSILLQSAYAIRIGQKVPASCFYPAPKVESCLLVLERLPNPVIFSPERKKLIRSLFLNRRKQLHKQAHINPTTAAWFDQLLAEGAILPTARAEEIPLKYWQRLAIV